SASTAMTDAPMTAFYVLSVYLWMTGLDRASPRRLLAAGLLVFVTAFTKYYGLTLFPLLGAYTILRLRRGEAWPRWFVPPFPFVSFLPPLLLMAGFQLWSYLLYGSVSLSDASKVAADGMFRRGETAFFHFFHIPVFTGGCIASVALAAVFVVRLRVWL